MEILENAIAVWMLGVVAVGLYGVFEKDADWSGYAPYPIARAILWPIVIPLALLVIYGVFVRWLRRIFSKDSRHPAHESSSTAPYWTDHAGRRRAIHPIEFFDDPQVNPEPKQNHENVRLTDPDSIDRRKYATAYARAWNRLEPTLVPKFDESVSYRSHWMEHCLYGHQITDYLVGKIEKAKEGGPFSKGPLGKV